MSFSPALDAFCFKPLDIPGRRFPRRELPRRTRGSMPPARAAARSDHPVLFMSGLLLATSLAVIGLWQGLGLLLPH
ncbi:MAG TPA: hypothetical protein VN723_11465 [Rhizomicrobium sp.]|jgi:hypothetical protein|nr:hypothetical protein [Rhizomicrobium sp.]